MAAAEPGSGERRWAAARFSAALNGIDADRREEAARPRLHPAAAKVLATLDREWEGLARHKEFPELPLDNYADVPVMPMSVCKVTAGLAKLPGSSA
jgi:transposase